MTEIVNENVEELDGTIENQEESNSNVVDPIEERAAAMGWNKDFEGEPEDFIDAKEFIRRKPLFDKIDSQKRELKETQKAVKLLQEHNAKIAKAEYARAVADLKAEKKVALENGDADRLIEIDDQIADLKAEEKAVKPQPTIDPRFVEWTQTNTWYTKDAELREVADEVGMSHSRSHPEKSPDEILDYVVERVKKLYPEKFRNVNKDRPSTVEGSSTTTPSRKQTTEFVLSEDERRAMNTFIRAGALTKEQYIEQIKQVRGE
jgi:hypothetical protein